MESLGRALHQEVKKMSKKEVNTAKLPNFAVGEVISPSEKKKFWRQ